MKQLIQTFIYLFLPALTCYGATENKIETTYIKAQQKPNTRFVEIFIEMKYTGESFLVRNIKTLLAYDLACEHQPYHFKHERESGNLENPYIDSGFTVYYSASNGTDDDMHSNGYEMYKAWEWLIKNPDQKVYCHLQYQAKAGFSKWPMTMTAGASFLPISVSFNPTSDVVLSQLKSRTIIMLPPENSKPGGGGECIANCTPLLIDLDQDGINLGNKGAGVQFDLLANNKPLLLQWVAPNGNEAFLAMDLNDNQQIDNGAELFGSGTTLISSDLDLAPNGFVALAQYDTPELGGNDDGYITEQDSIWPQLILWLDKNANGISDSGELTSLSETVITKLNPIPKTKEYIDNAGNEIPLWSSAYSNQKEHNKYQLVDVYFKILQQ